MWSRLRLATRLSPSAFVNVMLGPALLFSLLGQSRWAPDVTNCFLRLLATRFARLAQKIVCLSHQNLFDVIARRSVRKQRVQMVTVEFILVVLVQRVCGWAGFGIS